MMSEHFGFPRGLTYVELKRYESMSLFKKTLVAHKIGDDRVFLKLIELGANIDNRVSRFAVDSNDEELLNKLILHRSIDYASTLDYIIHFGRTNMFDIIIKHIKEDLTIEDLNNLLFLASSHCDYDITI